jgi:Fe-S cluster assembly protein SufD
MKINNVATKIENNELLISQSGDYVFDFENEPISLNVDCEKNAFINILISDLSNDIDLTFYLQEYANVNVKIMNRNSEKKAHLHGNLNKNSILNVYLVDFSKNNFYLTSNIIMVGDNASSEFRVSSVSKNNSLKNYVINYDHLAKNNSSKLNVYGVSEDTSELNVTGVSHIEADSIKSNANQKVKVILFDKESKGKAHPILKIDCDDIKASHGCAIGSLDDNHIYYLLSRGISIDDARRLIVLGYLLPIKKYFSKDEQEYIDNYVRSEF